MPVIFNNFCNGAVRIRGALSCKIAEREGRLCSAACCGPTQANHLPTHTLQAAGAIPSDPLRVLCLEKISNPGLQGELLHRGTPCAQVSQVHGTQPATEHTFAPSWLAPPRLNVSSYFAKVSSACAFMSSCPSAVRMLAIIPCTLLRLANSRTRATLQPRANSRKVATKATLSALRGITNEALTNKRWGHNLSTSSSHRSAENV